MDEHVDGENVEDANHEDLEAPAALQ